MSRKRYFTLCALALAGAFAGGYAANRAIPVAHAQVLRIPQDIRASEVTLVNPQGKVQATLRNGISGAELTLDDANGNPRVELGAPAGIVVRDATGRVVWSSPRGIGIVPAGGQ